MESDDWINESLLLIDCHLINMFQTLGTQQQSYIHIFRSPQQGTVKMTQKKQKVIFPEIPGVDSVMHFSADSVTAGTEKCDCL